MDSPGRNELDYFRLRLAETITWCSAQQWSFQPRVRSAPAEKPANEFERIKDVLARMSRPDPPPRSGTGLRTAQLRPSPIDDTTEALFRAGYPEDQMWPPAAMETAQSEHQWSQQVEQLATQRAALLDTQKLAMRQLALPLSKESLLAYFPQVNCSDGAAAIASDGFFDFDNIPAWDTWVVYMPNDHLLLSWVPDSLVEVIGNGIDSNPEYCIGWATDFDTPSIRRLKEADLLR